MNSHKKVAFASLAIASFSSVSLFANEFSNKGAYITAGIGVSKTGDIDVVNVTQDIEFDPGLGLDLGFGYDLGKTRIEAQWVRGQSDLTKWVGNSIKTDSSIDSLIGSVYYDFRESKKFTPFLGISLGSTNFELDGSSKSGMTYGLGYGVSYKTTESTELFLKGQTLMLPELTIGSINFKNANYTTVSLGMRFRFN